MDQKDDEKLRAIFDSYCKTVIRNAGRNIRKRYMRQMKNEIIVDFSSGWFMDEATARDDIPGERLYITYEGKDYPVRSLELYEKLIQLPYAQLEACASARNT